MSMRLWLTVAAAGLAVGWVRRGHGATLRWGAHVAQVASGPIDVAGVRALVDEVVASRPVGAVARREVDVPAGPGPHGRPAHTELLLTPRTAGAVRVALWWWEPGNVCVWLDDDLAIQLTAPIDVNQGEEQPFLPMVRRMLEDAAAGRAHRSRTPQQHAVALWSDDSSLLPRGCTPPEWEPVEAWT